MAGNNYNSFSGYQYSPRSPFMGDPMRNPYEMEFRTPHGYPPRLRESPTGFSPRQPFSSNRLKRPFPQNSADSPNRSPYGGYSPFQHSASTPYAANLSSTSYTPNLSFQRSPNVSPYGINSSSFQQSPSMTSSPSQFSRHSSGFSNRFLSSPKSTYQRKNQRSDWGSNPGGSSDVRNYYRPSMVSDPWENLKPSRIGPLQTRRQYCTDYE